MTTTVVHPGGPGTNRILLRPGDRARIVYRNAVGETTTRLIDVLQRHETVGGVAYVRAWCHLRSEERTFREDRVLEARAEGVGTVRQAPAPAVIARAACHPPATTVIARAAYHPPATTVIARAACHPPAATVIARAAYHPPAAPARAWSADRLARHERRRTKSRGYPGRFVALFVMVATGLIAHAGWRDATERAQQRELLVSLLGGEPVPVEADVDRSVGDAPTRELFASADATGDAALTWAEVAHFQRRLVAAYRYRSNERALAAFEFLRAGGGDCEDWAIVTAGMLAWWGVDARVGVIESATGAHAITLVPVAQAPVTVGSFAHVGRDGTEVIYVPIDYGEVGDLSSAVRGPWRLTIVYNADAIVGRRM